MSPTSTNRLTSAVCLALLVGFAGTGVSTQAQVNANQAPTVSSRLKRMLDRNNPPSFPPLEVPGELVVRLAPGANGQNAQALANYFGGTVKRRLRFAPNTYVFQDVQGSLDQAVAQLNTSTVVVRATKNGVFRPAALPPSDPNDPLLSQQWALSSLNASNVWGITVGQRLVNGPKKNAVVALLDSGVQISHPDLTENFDSTNAWDFILDQPYDETAANTSFFDAHGTNVAGCIAPLTNNSEGIAGLPWEGVKILPCRVADSFGTGTLNTGIPASAVLDAIYYSIQQQVDVINMSFGLNTTDPLIQQAITDAYDQGIVPVASSGDGFFFSRAVEFPATMDETIAVAAVGPSGEPATYSNSGAAVDVAAPGGNDANFADTSRQLVLTFPTDSFTGPVFDLPVGYGRDQGTSFAAGYVSGTLATLISQGAGDGLTGAERVEYLRTLLQSTARNPFGRVTNELGHGIVDAAAALRRITQYADLIAPEPNEVTASVTEPLTARVVLPVQQPLQDGDFQIFKNGLDVTGDAQILDPFSGFVEYVPAADDIYLTGVNTLDVVTENPNGDPDFQRSLNGDAVIAPGVNIPARALRFRVQPRIEYPGLRMFSIPYELDGDSGSDTLTFLLGGNEGRLARWLPDQNRYAIFDPFGAPQESEADLTTDDAGVARPPVGLGFWLRILPLPDLPQPPGEPPTNPNTQQLRLQIRGRSERSSFYSIPLKPGFNQVGNPYPFRVPFNVINVRFGNEVMSVAEAYRRRLMSNVIWRYQDGRYTFRVLPQGELVPWDGHWIQSFRDLTLIVPRVGAGLGQSGALASSAPSATPLRGKGAWSTTLRATARDGVRGEVFLGQVKGSDPLNKLELPPAPAGAEDLRIRGERGTRLVQDLRPINGKETWLVEYETSRPGEAVQLSWDRFPKGVKGSLKVEGSSQSYDMDARTTLSLKPAKAGVQRLRVTVAASSRFGLG